MSRVIFLLAAFVVVACAGPALAVYTVDIGTPASEAPYSPFSWGPVQPSTSGGSWGGIATDPLSSDGLCRVIWDASDNNPTATLTFPRPIVSVSIRHLQGLADDSLIPRPRPRPGVRHPCPGLQARP